MKEVTRKSSLKQLLRSEKVVLGGIVCEYLHPSLFMLYQQAGFDFVYLENEHAWFEPTCLTHSISSAHGAGFPVIAKIPELERAEVGRLLECGATGIQLPRTESRAEVENLFDYLKFPPLGSRAFAPRFGSSDYRLPTDWRAWMDQQNEESILVVHLETRRGYEHAEELISFSGVDMVYVGTADFSVSMGCAGDYDHPKLVRAMEEILEICQRYKVPFGTTLDSCDTARRWMARGARFFEVIDELSLVLDGASQLVREYRAAAAEVSH